MNKLANIAIALSILAGSALPAAASAFWPGQVINIAPTDTLKVRKWPSPVSKIIDAYALDASISMMGRCKDTLTNVSFQIDAGGSASWKYSKMSQPNVWCQVMTDDGQIGWARGSFIQP
jgi:hypothetical protein